VNRIVVHLDPMQDGGSACQVARMPYNVANPYTVACVRLDDLVNIVGPEAVREVGERLAERIRTNDTVKEVLGLALTSPLQGASVPICFRVGDADAHALSWEALVMQNAFLALDDRWPIARIARGGAVADAARRVFAPPLKVAVVISAVERPGLLEWEGIAKAVTEARAANQTIDVLLFAAEESVFSAASALGGVDARPMPATATQLITELRDAGAHFVHLYCHGAIAEGVRRLELGTVLDFEAVPPRSSVLMRVLELGVALAQAGTWGVLLNTCRGAEAADEAITHAEEIVSAGVPFAIGHRRLVDAADAAAFSAAYYPAMFKAVRYAAAAPLGNNEIEWADTLVDARRVLRDNHGADPARNDRWTVPVLYCQSGSFELVPSQPIDVSDTRETLAEQDTVGGIVDTLAASAPAELLADLRTLAP
jgi:hypothetical protein